MKVSFLTTRIYMETPINGRYPPCLNQLTTASEKLWGEP